METTQKLYREGNKFYLVTMWENGVVTLKIKENGWSDIWSIGLREVDSLGNDLD